MEFFSFWETVSDETIIKIFLNSEILKVASKTNENVESHHFYTILFWKSQLVYKIRKINKAHKN